MASRNFVSQRLYSFHAFLVKIDCQFTVDPTNGAGITGLVGGGVKSVFMHTSTTPATGSPNPANGFIQVQFQDNYQWLYGMSWTAEPPLTGNTTSSSANETEIIKTLGTATLAQWQAKGLPPGITPAVGVCFTATASGTIGGSAAVGIPQPSNITTIELCGNPNKSLALSNQPVNGGGYVTLQCLKNADAAPTLTMNSYTPAGTITNGTPDTFAGTPAVLTGTITAPTLSYAPAAPVAGTVIQLSFMLSNSSVTQQGD